MLARTVLALCLVSSLASAQELDKKQQGLIKRLQPQIEKDTEALGKIGDESWQLTQRVVDDYKRRIARYEGQLKDLPADHAEVKPALAKLDELRALLDKRAGALAAKTAAGADAAAKLTTLLTAPEHEDDLKTLDALLEQYRSRDMYRFDNYVFHRWPDHSLVLRQREQAQSLRETQKKVEALIVKYAECATFTGRLEGQAVANRIEMASRLKDLAQLGKGFQESLDAFIAGVPEQIDKDGALLKTAADKAVAAGDYAAFIQPEGEIEKRRYRITNITAIWSPLAPSDEARAKLSARAEALLAQCDAAAQKLAAAMIRDNKGPANKYSGADRGKLEAFVRAEWSKKYPADAILAVRFEAASFDRHTAWKLDPSTHSFVKTDESNIPVWVIIKDGPKQAIKYFCSLYKLHLRGDSLHLGFPYRNPKGPAPMYRLLVSNL
jgi:hypothetical protein